MLKHTLVAIKQASEVHWYTNIITGTAMETDTAIAFGTVIIRRCLTYNHYYSAPLQVQRWRPILL